MLINIARKTIGQIILFADKITSPKSVSRHPDEQSKIDSATSSLHLYEMNACPYCVKVRREIKRLALNITRKNVKQDPQNKQFLIAHGGKFQVPCLHINSDTQDIWLYESDEIINYLQNICR